MKSTAATSRALTTYRNQTLALASVFFMGCGCIQSIGVQAAQPAVTTEASNQQIMQDLTASLNWLLRYALEGDPEYGGEGADEAIYTVDKLSAAAALAEEHIGGTDISRRKLGISLSESIAELAFAVDNGNTSGINFHVSDLVNRCVACHMRFSRSVSSEEEPIFQIPEDLALDRSFAARFYVTTRQFENALSLIEEEILAKRDDLLAVDLDGRFDEYLWIAIRSRKDPGSAAEFLRSLRKSVDRPYYLSRLMDRWITDLDEIEPLIANIDGSVNDRDFAYQLFDQSRHTTQVPFSREALVTDITAATLLRSRLDSQTSLGANEIAETNYLLALLEAKLVGSDYTAPQMEFLLEAAIRAEPAGPRAPAALAILEEFGLHVAREYENPEERFRRSMIRIDELRDLIEQSRK